MDHFFLIYLWLVNSRDNGITNGGYIIFQRIFVNQTVNVQNWLSHNIIWIDRSWNGQWRNLNFVKNEYKKQNNLSKARKRLMLPKDFFRAEIDFFVNGIHFNLIVVWLERIEKEPSQSSFLGRLWNMDIQRATVSDSVQANGQIDIFQVELKGEIYIWKYQSITSTPSRPTSVR